MRLSGAALHHLRNVLRAKAGDEVVVCDSRANEFVCTVAHLGASEALLEVKGTSPRPTPSVSLTVACALPRAGKMDDIVDSLTQVGVDAIIPVTTERVVVRLDDARRAARLERWRKIARSAAEQSQRGSIPTVEPIATLESVLGRSGDFDLRLMPVLTGGRRLLRDVLSGSLPRRILVLIGPEGDFTPGEVEMAVGAGFVPVSLGENVLRVGTAAVAVASYIRLSLPG